MAPITGMGARERAQLVSSALTSWAPRCARALALRHEVTLRVIRDEVFADASEAQQALPAN
jgi:hypothetical protein